LAYIRDCFEGKAFHDGSERHPLFSSKVCSQIMFGLFGSDQVKGSFEDLQFLIEFRPLVIFNLFLKAAENPLWLEDDSINRTFKNSPLYVPLPAKFPVSVKQDFLTKPQNVFDRFCEMIVQRNSILVIAKFMF
jgi:hypothetical protein